MDAANQVMFSHRFDQPAADCSTPDRACSAPRARRQSAASRRNDPDTMALGTRAAVPLRELASRGMIAMANENQINSVFTFRLGNHDDAIASISTSHQAMRRLFPGDEGRHFRLQGISSRIEFPYSPAATLDGRSDSAKGELNAVVMLLN